MDGQFDCGYSLRMPFDQRLIEARLALSMIGPDEMPALAWDALEAGLDGPAIRRVAALLHPSGWEVDQILPKFVADAGMVSLSPQEASVRIARHIARRILDEGLDPIEHTRDFELLWIRADHPEALSDAGMLDDQKYTAEYMGQTQAEFREYARGVLVSLVNGESKSECETGSVAF
jgi:hypothetical protein